MPQLTGIFAAAATPLKADYTIDEDKLVDHCRWLLDEGGCDGINLLGTTGEATSFSVEQRIAAMRAIAGSGLRMDRFMVGTGAAALDDAVELTRTASDFGFAGALLLPPFYYKGIREEALEFYVTTIIKRACGRDLGLYLYHIPQMSGVSYSVRVLKSLLVRFPDIIAGVKDSSGDLQHAQILTEQLPSLSIFPGSEATLARAPNVRFAGCISGTTNVTGAIVSRGWQMRGKESGAKILQAALEIRTAIETFPLIPAVKWLLADVQKEDGWRRVHPPLSGLSDAEWRSLRGRLATMGFFD
jgi:4-hydroxy-tetrahydrodipicolinate synthase